MVARCHQVNCFVYVIKDRGWTIVTHGTPLKARRKGTLSLVIIKDLVCEIPYSCHNGSGKRKDPTLRIKESVERAAGN
jgi:hypothetical protein